jgi:DNA repair exonuclease SbcCD ATPase subunit
MNSQQLANRIATFRSGSVRLRQQLEYEAASIVRLQDKVKRIEEEKLDLQKALSLIDKCIELVSAHGIGKIEHIVTAGLQQVFKDEKEPISFIVEKKETARGYNYRLLCKQGETIGNPMTTFGGGVQNMCAFLLRVVMCKRFKLAKFLVFDESFNNVNGSRNQSRLSSMLHTLTQDFGFTILVITGQKRLAEAADRIYEVSSSENIPVLRPVQHVDLSDSE